MRAKSLGMATAAKYQGDQGGGYYNQATFKRGSLCLLTVGLL
jgi:hypothetical protein